MATLGEIQALIQDQGIRRVDLLVTDLIGRWQHFSIPAHKVDEDLVERGQGFDGSSLRGFQSIDESDMLLRPDLDSARIDPTESVPTLKFICNVHDPITGERYSRDPRYVATKAEQYMIDSGIADQAFFGPELEFFLFDHVQFGLKINSSFHVVESNEADWNSARDEGGNNTGYKSYRLCLIGVLPRTSLPKALYSAAEYEALLDNYRRMNFISDGSELWWASGPRNTIPPWNCASAISAPGWRMQCASWRCTPA